MLQRGSVVRYLGSNDPAAASGYSYLIGHTGVVQTTDGRDWDYPIIVKFQRHDGAYEEVDCAIDEIEEAA